MNGVFAIFGPSCCTFRYLGSGRRRRKITYTKPGVAGRGTYASGERGSWGDPGCSV